MRRVRRASGVFDLPSLGTANSSLSVATREDGRDFPRGSGGRAVFTREWLYEDPQTLCLRDTSNQSTRFAQGAPRSCLITRNKSDR